MSHTIHIASVVSVGVVSLTVRAKSESNQVNICDNMSVTIRVSAKKLLVFFLKRNLKDIGYMFMD